MRVKLTQYAKMTGVSVRTLWRRINDGSLPIVKSETGRVFVEINDDIKPYKLNVCVYARVSSSENKDNLERQKERLISYCNAKGYKVSSVVTEIGSGLNDERKKLEKVLLDKSINLIVVEHKDRLARFGLNYIQKLLDYSVVTTECDHLDWMIRKPSYNAVVEKLTLREINHD